MQNLTSTKNSNKKIDKDSSAGLARNINIALLFSGNGSNLENIIRYFRQDSVKSELASQKINADFVLAICNKKEAFGITRCKNLGIECKILAHKDFATRAKFDNALFDILHKEGIDLVILAGFMRILGSEIVSKIRAINIHPSFLPLHKGANAIKDSYLSSEDFGGVSVHWVSKELDSGEIILQEKLLKIKGESMEEFEKRIHALEYDIYPKAIISALKTISGLKKH